MAIIKKVVVGIFVIMISNLCFSQTDPVIIGQPFPDFVLNDIQNYPKKNLRVSDFEGKYLILDFFNKGCISCIQSWPKTNKISEEYKGRLQFFLIGVENNPKSGPKNLAPVKEMYETYRKSLSLNLPAAFDTTTSKRFKINAGPLYIWIDKEGIVQAITAGSQELTPSNLEAFLSGQKFEFNYAGSFGKQQLIRKMPMFLNGNLGADTAFSYRSVFAPFDPMTMNYSTGSPYSPYKLNNGIIFQVAGYTIQDLYSLSYLPDPDELYEPVKLGGKKHTVNSDYFSYYKKAIIEISDSVLLERFGESKDGYMKRYCYSLIMPPAIDKTPKIVRSMRNDLDNYFGFDVRIETRPFPCYKLVGNNSSREKLLTKGGKRMANAWGTKKGYVDNNIPFYMLLKKISYQCPLDSEVPLLNETGIDLFEKIDIDVDCLWMDMEDVQRALGKYELRLEKTEVKLKCVVVRDPQPVKLEQLYE